MSGVFYLCDVLKFIIHGLYKCSLSQADLISHTHERVSHIVLDFCDELYSIYKETFKKSFPDISFITKEFSLDVFKQCALLKRFPVIHASCREYKIQDFSFVVDYWPKDCGRGKAENEVWAILQPEEYLEGVEQTGKNPLGIDLQFDDNPVIVIGTLK